jgi:TonB-dependent starch-binding outer membrane protein SusC
MRITLTRYKTGRLILLLSLFLSASTFAQRTVTGTVIDDSNGEPMIGATVLLKGTSNGTTTGLDGTYSISVPGPEAILVFSFIGSETQEVLVGDQTKIDVHLALSTQLLDELVVIGYGTVKKSDLTGSVAVVTSENLNRTPSSTFDRALQGKAAGVMVSQTSGKPGEGISIRIRGIGSINKAADPIYVIDGVVTGAINSINPNDIESMQILKDASASAIYGADGANGVVIITTKRGKPGKTKVSYSSYASINRVPKKLDIMNANEYAKFYNDLYAADGLVPDTAYSDGFRQAYYGNGWEKGSDWQDAIVQTAYTQNHYLNVSGGNEYSSFSISGSYYKENGILRNTGADRYTIRANSDFNIGKYIKVGETVNLNKMSYMDAGSQQGNAWQVSTIVSPLMKIYNSDNLGGYEGPQKSFNYLGSNRSATGRNDKPNPLGELELPDYRRYTTNVLASVYAEVKPVDWLSLKVTPSVELFSGRTNNWLPAYDMGVRSNNRASLFVDNYTGISYSLENQLTFNKSFGDHNLNATAVYHIRGTDRDDLGITGFGYNYPQLSIISQASELGTPQSSLSQDRMLSSLGRVTYDFKGKYLLSASIRKDGSSRFGPENRFGVFPAFSVGWKMNEDLLQNVSQINMLKLRFGWGKTGNSNIGNFGYDDFLTDGTNFASVFGYPQTLAPGTNIFYSFANPIIKWEAAAMTNFGFDLNVFNNKVQLSAEYYIKNTDDLLVQRKVSIVYGRSGDGSFPWVNLGKLQNRGFELAATYRQMEGAFTYSSNLTLTTIKNVVKSIPADLIQGNNITSKDHSVGSLYGYIAERIITPEDFDTSGTYKYALPSSKVAPGDLKFKDLNNDGLINASDRTIIGKPTPDFILGLGFDCYYKGFDFSFFMNGMFNYQIFNAQRAELTSFTGQDLNHNKLREFANNYYTTERPSTEYVRADMSGTANNDRISTWWIENGSFMRMKDMQFGYSLSTKVVNSLGISKGRVYASAMNLFVLTNYKGRDPENAVMSTPISSGTDAGSYPTPRTFTFGVQVEF